MLQDLTGNVLGIEKLLLGKPAKEKVVVKSAQNAEIGRKVPSPSVKPVKNNSTMLDEGAVACESDICLEATFPCKDSSDTNHNPSISGNFIDRNGNSCESSSSSIIQSISGHGTSGIFENTATLTSTPDKSVKKEPSHSTRHVDVELSEVDGAIKISMEMDAKIFNEVGPSIFSTLEKSNLSVRMSR